MQQNNYKSSYQKSKLNFSYLIVGIDIGKNRQYARATDYEGNELGRKLVFTRDVYGLNQMYMWINSLKLQYKKDNVLVAMEPTGIYWENIYHGLKELDGSINVALVDVKDVINVRKLFFESVKNDTVDSLAIARTAVLKGYKQRLYRSQQEQELRDLTSFREQILKETVCIKNKITNILDKAFPEYKCLYKDYFNKSSLLLLSRVFCPNDIKGIDLEHLYSQIKEQSKTCISKKKLQQIKDIASNSIGINPTVGIRRKFNFYIQSLTKMLAEIDDIEKEIAELTKDNEMITFMTEINGIGTVSAANILAEIGDFNKFENAKQLISYCGFNLKVNESGIHKGKTTISKKGNSRLRAYLFRVMLPIIKNNKEFTNLHNHYKTRKENPLKPMQSIVALICKLLRILWRMAKTKTAYNPEITFKEAIAAVA